MNVNDKWINGALVGVVLVALGAANGCASSRGFEPVIDPAGVDMGRYQSDLAQCKQIAEQVEQKAGEGAVGGAVVGGLIGAVIGDSDTVRKGAGVGAISGAAKGADETRREKEKVVKNCLRGRGYTVLN